MMGSPATNLAAIPFEDDIKRLTKNFSGREWVFKDIDDWLAKKGNRFFLLTGEPGVGKSAIAAKLIQIRQYITAYHFCRDRDEQTINSKCILRSLAAQLAEKLPDYREALANSIKPHLLQVGVKIDIKSVVNSISNKISSTNLFE